MPNDCMTPWCLLNAGCFKLSGRTFSSTNLHAGWSHPGHSCGMLSVLCWKWVLSSRALPGNSLLGIPLPLNPGTPAHHLPCADHRLSLQSALVVHQTLSRQSAQVTHKGMAFKLPNTISSTLALTHCALDSRPHVLLLFLHFSTLSLYHILSGGWGFCCGWWVSTTLRNLRALSLSLKAHHFLRLVIPRLINAYHLPGCSAILMLRTQSVREYWKHKFPGDGWSLGCVAICMLE